MTTVDATLTGSMHPGAGRHSSRARTFLVVAEMSIACVVVIASVLLMRSFANLQRVDPGCRGAGRRLRSSMACRSSGSDCCVEDRVSAFVPLRLHGAGAGAAYLEPVRRLRYQ
jgi:hypothetical protein